MGIDSYPLRIDSTACEAQPWAKMLPACPVLLCTLSTLRHMLTWRRVPNMPDGYRRLMLLLPTKSCAMPTMVPAKLVSPWWYAALSDT